jgi:integrase
MAIYKRGKTYWYKFMFQGRLVRESTKQTNHKVARQIEAAHRIRLAKEKDELNAAAKRLGCDAAAVLRCPECEKWFAATGAKAGNDGQRYCSSACARERQKKNTPVPTLRAFCEQRFERWAKATFEKSCRNNWLWFRAGTRRLKAYAPLANCALDTISNETVSGFVAFEQSRVHNTGNAESKKKHGLAVSSINSAIRVLRRVLNIAVEWGVVESAPTLTLVPGERRRERVITTDEEERYLRAAPPLLRSVATVLADTGLRPDECYRLRWENVNWNNRKFGTLLVTHGKTLAARRVLPMTPRVKVTLHMRWETAGQPAEGWVWPAPTKSGHIDQSSLKKQHEGALRSASAEANKNNEPAISPFVLYSFRHTFLTRLGESGCDAWTLARIAGHSSIAISSRYVHPSEDAVLTAMSRLSGHNSGHSPETRELQGKNEQTETAEKEGKNWRARRDSNSRPIAPEAIALSS